MLSNIPILRHLRPVATPASVGVRTAGRNEIEPALRLILRPAPGESAQGQIDEFARMVGTAEAAGGMWIGERAGLMITAVLPVISPGRTMLLLAAPGGGNDVFSSLTRMCIEAACQHAAAAGIRLAQALTDPLEDQIRAVFLNAGFRRLAELTYLQSTVRRMAPAPALPEGMRWVAYSADTHAQFGQAILSAYQDSLDCPALNGMRQIDDVIAGHKATGEFDPNLWLMLREGDKAVGVMLLAPVARAGAVEVVYLGVTPECRRRGHGDLMMRQATHLASARQARLTLAVDSQNTPALRLYWRHGMQTICKRLALLRELGS